MYQDLLPIGSVVLLNHANKRVMICGRVVTRTGEDKIYDYAACYFPEGIVDPRQMVFFDRAEINRIFFIGLQDEEELHFREEVLGTLGELEIRDGKIVEKRV